MLASKQEKGNNLGGRGEKELPTREEMDVICVNKKSWKKQYFSNSNYECNTLGIKTRLKNMFVLLDNRGS